MTADGRSFDTRVDGALHDPQLQQALGHVRRRFVASRAAAKAGLPEWGALSNEATAIKDHVLANLDLYLEAWERKATAAGANVHWASSAADARGIVLEICRAAGAKTVTKGKSMVAEEIHLNAHLEANGITPVETDLGEYIIQLRGEMPSHIIAPAVHLTKAQVEADFRKAHTHLPVDRSMVEPRELVAEARGILREKFLAADVGITGANFLIAETGSSVIVTNEGNGDLTQVLPRVHVVVTSIDKVVPTLEDVSVILRLLARSATGQEISTYTTFSTGPRRPGDPDGPETYHVVVVDNGRSELLGTALQPVLRCIRCGACMNHCPVYQAIGGHAYGAVYAGPIGAVLTPSLDGVMAAKELPNATPFCGRCEEVCPMQIPLPALMRHFREEQVKLGKSPARQKVGLAVWAWLAGRPKLYRLATRAGMRMMELMAGRNGRLRWLPLASGWTRHRDMPAPEGPTFHDLWAQRQRASPPHPVLLPTGEKGR
jgi:L-lactate dehydrogenase complex protein LldF